MVAVVQRMVLQHIKPDTILVGHALENDLKALKVSAVQPMPEQAAVLAIHSSEASQCHDASCQQYCTHGPCMLGVAGSGTVSLHPQSVCVGSGCGLITCPLVAFDRTGTRENECVGAGLLGLTGAFLDFAMVRYCTVLICPVLSCPVLRLWHLPRSADLPLQGAGHRNAVSTPQGSTSEEQTQSAGHQGEDATQPALC